MWLIESRKEPSLNALILAEILRAEAKGKIIYSAEFSKEAPIKFKISDSLFRKTMKYLLDNKFIERHGYALISHKGGKDGK